MKSNIAPHFYHEADILVSEQDKIFKKNWHFMGFLASLERPNDFITRRIGHVPVVVQNSKGSIKAFLNVCSHRFSLIQKDETGNRPLVCPYHGWAYDQLGIPSGIPKKPLFKDFSKEELFQLKLREFKVDFCGNLCFVSLDAEVDSLRNYLGTFYEELEQMSLSLGNMVDVNRMTIKANWKVIVENTLESYHVQSIHTNTFRKLGAQGLDFAFTPYHSSWNAELNIKRTDTTNAKIDNLFPARSYKIDGYKHILVFPNLLISSTHGTSYNYSLAEPITSESTRFTSYVFTARTEEGEKKALLNAFQKTLIDFNRQVFEEDKEICQVVQRGVAHTKLQGVLSLEEERVHAFQNTYLKLLENASKD